MGRRHAPFSASAAKHKHRSRKRSYSREPLLRGLRRHVLSKCGTLVNFEYGFERVMPGDHMPLRRSLPVPPGWR